jgi:hypothetical protein
MSLPREFWICGTRFDVTYDPGAAWAYVSWETGTINMRAGMPAEVHRENLMHEIIHGIDRAIMDKPLRDVLTQQANEVLCRMEESQVLVFSRALWMTLTDPRNADAVRWMLAVTPTTKSKENEMTDEQKKPSALAMKIAQSLWCDDFIELQSNVPDAAAVVDEVLAQRAPAVADAAPTGETENRKLRYLLAMAYSGAPNLYLDDGCIQDTRKHPFIDYVRDSVHAIERAMRERGIKSDAAAPTGDAIAEAVQEAAGWKREADRLLRLCQQQERKIEELTPYIDLFRRLDKKFGCGHTENGAEDAEALLRHVDDLSDRVAGLTGRSAKADAEQV